MDIKNNFFGKLTFAEDIQSYSGHVDFLGDVVEVLISAPVEEEDLRLAEFLINYSVDNIELAKNEIEKDLYPIYKAEWSSWFSRARKKKFLKTIRLNSFVFTSNKQLDLWFNSGNLFSGHSVVVRLSKEMKFFNVRLAG